MHEKATPITNGAPRFRRIEVPGLRMLHATYPGPMVLPLHIHESTCITVGLDGGFRETMGSQEYHSAEATLLSRPIGEPHDNEFARTGSRHIIIELPHPEEDRFRPYARLLGEIISMRDREVAGLAHRLAREIEEPDDLSPLAVEGLGYELLATALRRRSHRRSTTLPRWLENAREYLHAHFADSFTVQELAEALEVHPGHLARTFRSHFGVPVGQYVRQLRVDHAAALLTRSDLSLAQVACLAGFYDQSHLTRLFKRVHGCTPQAFRNAKFRGVSASHSES